MATLQHGEQIRSDMSRKRTLQRLTTIQETACRFVIERGYDNFTMDELAAAVGVSRRTLFNYVPDKSSAVLGISEPEENVCIDEFRQGRPSGALIPDLVHAIDSFLEDTDDPFHSVEHHRLVQQAIARDAKVARLAMERFVQLSGLLTTLVCEREGWPAGDLRAKTVSATFLTLIKLALDEFTSRNASVEFRSVFHEVLDAERAVRALP